MYGKYFNIDSVGVGFEQKIYKNIKFFLKIGRYMPQYDEQGFSDEGVYYRQIKYWVPPLAMGGMSPNYGVTLDDVWGGEIGLDFKLQVYKKLFAGVGLAYRYVKIPEFTYGWREYPGDMQGWFLTQTRDFGGYKVMGSIQWAF